MSKLIINSADLNKAIARIQDGGAYAFDLETRAPLVELHQASKKGDRLGLNLSPRTANIVGLGLATIGWAGYVALPPFYGDDGWRAEVSDQLRGVFDNKKLHTVGHNIRFDLRFLRHRWGLVCHNILHDTMLMATLVDENICAAGDSSRRFVSTQSLKVMSVVFLDRLMTKYNESDWDTDDLHPAITNYGIADVRVTFDLAHWLFERIREAGQWDFYWNHVQPLTRIAHEMETLGIPVDIEAVERAHVRFLEQADKLSTTLSVTLGEINLNSTKQVAAQLEKLHPGIVIPQTASKRPSLDAKVSIPRLLAEYPDNTALCDTLRNLLTLRRARKLSSTYTTKWLASVHEDGRIRGNFNPRQTRTGRWSSSNPNLQNIPSEADIRDWVVAPEGYMLVVGDLKQADVRMLAALTDDQGLKDLMNRDEDIYTAIAAKCGEVLDRSTEEGKLRRFHYKQAILGIMYGRGAVSVAKELGLDDNAVKEMYRTMFSSFPGLFDYGEARRAELKMTGKVVIPFGGRRRPIFSQKKPLEDGWQRRLYNRCFAEEVKAMKWKLPREPKKRAQAMYGRAERQAINAPAQGGVGNLLDKAMCEMYYEHGFTAILQVHDEIVYLAPRGGNAQMVADLLRDAMEIEFQGVQFKADIHIVKKWGGAKR